jgi:hypothetical protein
MLALTCFLSYELLVGAVVDQTFTKYEKGQFSTGKTPGIEAYLGSGWVMQLPSGEAVPRSFLQRKSEPLVSLGPEAVPHLLKWVMHNNLAIRYIAIYSLERITGIQTTVSYFDPDKDGIQRQHTCKRWKCWWDQRLANKQ